MNYKIFHASKKLTGNIDLTASKSESNRALIIQALCKQPFEIENLSNADDSQLLKQALEKPLKQKEENHFDTGAGGTTMRFLTAYLATQPGTHIVTGSERMKERPISILVDALNKLGADIEYVEKKGFPPIKIKTKNKFLGGEVEMEGNVSSQFISALLLVAPILEKGLFIKFTTELTSFPYINLTLKMLQEFRVYGQWQENSISVSKQDYAIKSDIDYKYKVEADWSSASYWYAIAALADEVDFYINGLKHPSLQGDSIVADIFSFFGIKTTYTATGVHLSKIKSVDEYFGYDFSDCPDLAQTVAVVVSALNIPSDLFGLHTLRIKESDRIEAIKTELHKIGCIVQVSDNDSIKIIPAAQMQTPSAFCTYNDHRMAMPFVSLAMIFPSIIIEQPEVVTKSYPEFWNDLKKVGFEITEL